LTFSKLRRSPKKHPDHEQLLRTPLASSNSRKKRKKGKRKKNRGNGGSSILGEGNRQEGGRILPKFK